MMLQRRPAGHAVRTSKFTEEQIAYALKQAELGTPVARRYATRWEAATGRFTTDGRNSAGCRSPRLRRLKQLEKRTRNSSDSWSTGRRIRRCLQNVLSKNSSRVLKLDTVNGCCGRFVRDIVFMNLDRRERYVEWTKCKNRCSRR